MSKFSHPKIFADLLILYKQYFKAHGNHPKIFRVTVGSDILKEISESMKLVTMINFFKQNRQSKQNTAKYIVALRGKIEIIKSYFLIAWEMKFISNGFYADIIERIEEISKQAASWGKWIENNSRK